MLKGIRLSFHGLAALATITLLVVGIVMFVQSPSSPFEGLGPGEHPAIVFFLLAMVAFLLALWRPLQGGGSGLVLVFLGAKALADFHGKFRIGPGMYVFISIALFFIVAGVLKRLE